MRRIALKKVEWQLWEAFDDVSFEELAAEVLWLHGESVLRDRDLIGRKLEPLYSKEHKQEAAGAVQQVFT